MRIPYIIKCIKWWITESNNITMCEGSRESEGDANKEEEEGGILLAQQCRRIVI